MVYTDMHIVGPAIDIAIRTIRNTSLKQCEINVVISKVDWQNNCDTIEANVNDYAAKMIYDRVGGPYPVAAFIGLSCTFANKGFLDLLRSELYVAIFISRVSSASF